MILLARILVAGLSGALIFSSYDPLGWWWAALIGISLLYLALSPWGKRTVSWKTGSVLAFVSALSLYLFLLPWIGEFVGKLPFIALSVFEALYSLFFGALATLIIARTKLAPLWFAAWFGSVEYVRSNWPLGGFAWVRLAWGQIDGPISALAHVGGPALISFVTALLGASFGALVLGRSNGARLRYAGIAVAGVAAVAAGTFSVPHASDSGSVKIAAIQGNVPRMGLDFNAQRRAVLANHARQTSQLSQPVDLVIWPENSSDVNPFTDSQARQLIDQAVSKVDAPTLVGTITQDEVGPRNTMVVFNPDGSTGDRHVKKYLQPFGEYMPFRKFFRMFSSYVDMAGNFQPGDGNGTIHMRAAQTGQDVILGIATCYEVAFDPAYRDAVRGGAEILASPTNNATFGFTDMTYQQLAMSRMRAKETDRAVVVAATSGVSALVRPDGSVEKSTRIFTADTLVAHMPLRNTTTLSVRFGTWIELGIVLLGLVGVALAISRRPSQSRSRQRTATRSARGSRNQGGRARR